MNELPPKSFDPNILPMDAFALSGTTASALRSIGLKEPWIFGAAVSTRKWILGLGHAPGDVVYHDEDGLWYMNLVATDAIEPDFSDAGIEGETWEWVGGSISGFVSGRGWWTKYAEGTLIQRYAFNSGTKSIVNQNIGTYGWSYYQSSETWTFPIDFYDLDYQVESVGDNASFVNPGVPAAVGSCSLGVRGISSTATNIRLVAVGRWKA